MNGGLAWTANLTYTTGYRRVCPAITIAATRTYYNAVTYDLGAIRPARK